MTRQATLGECYRWLRRQGLDVVAAAFVALVWACAGVEIEEDHEED